MNIYDKKPLTYAEQVELLKSRGLIIPDVKRAERLLSNISYYRLSAYMLPYKQRKKRSILDVFNEGTTWDMVYNLYVFDRKLRLLVFDAIERLEVAIRTQIVYQLSLKYGAHWVDRNDIFKSPSKTQQKNGQTITEDVFSDLQDYIDNQLIRNKAEVFIQHYRNKYYSPKHPPSWMSVEIMYFKHLSQICSGLKKRADIKDIASYFGLPPNIFCSWLHSINYVRNICAHHARLWNRDLQIIPKCLFFSKIEGLEWISTPNEVHRNKIYYFLCMLNFLLQTVNPTSSLKSRLKELLKEYEGVISLNAMGFPANWGNEKMWKS